MTALRSFQAEMANLKSCLHIVLQFLLVILTTAGPLPAQSAKNFYVGKTITMLAGSSPGGGTDQTVRLIARHMERYIPGKPSIVVVNKPGAGGM